MTEFVLSFLLFLVISVLDLFSKAGNRRSLEVATKPFIIPSLYLSIFMLASSMGGYLDHSYILVMGAVLYTAGDILLLWKNTMLFIVGVLSGIIIFLHPLADTARIRERLEWVRRFRDDEREMERVRVVRQTIRMERKNPVR